MSRLVLVSLLAACADSAPPAYVPLVTADWTLPTGSEAFWCATRTLTEDVHIGTLRALPAPGTHHTTVTSNEPSGPDSAGYPCWPELSDLWASGTGGEPLALPEGVGLEVKAGRQLRLTLHLFNAALASPLADNAAFDVAAADRTKYLGSLALGTPVDVGTSLWVEVNSLNKLITVPSGLIILVSMARS